MPKRTVEQEMIQKLSIALNKSQDEVKGLRKNIEDVRENLCVAENLQLKSLRSAGEVQRSFQKSCLAEIRFAMAKCPSSAEIEA